MSESAAVLAGVASQQQADRALAYLRANDWSSHGSLDVSPATPNQVISPVYEPLPSGFEAAARLSGDDPGELGFDTGLQLIRQFWDWILGQDPGSTFWEKASEDGTPPLAQFESLAHGWASSPTVTLTSDVLGVTPTSAGFATYSVIPHPAGPSWAQGSVPTPQGSIGVSWKSHTGSFGMSITAPAGTTGAAAVPTFGRQVRVTVDGHLAWDAGTSAGYGAHTDGTFVYVEGLGAGSHSVTSTYVSAAAAAVTVAAAPVTLDGAPGGLDHVAVTVTGIAPGTLDGALTVSAPAGWTAEPASVPVSPHSDGRVASASADFYVQVPSDAGSGQYPLTFTFSGDGTTASASASVQVSLYSFSDGTTDGYQATVTLTSGSQTLTTTVPVPANAWTPVDVDVSSWAYRDDITGISVSYAAVGSTTPWSMQFQIDDVGWS